MISVIIPVYKNTSLFLNNLRHNLPFLKGCEVVIVNDYPGESLEPLLASIPEIVLIENKKNGGFGPAMNIGVKKSTGSPLLFLNSDVILNDVSFLKAAEYLSSHPQTFAVSFAQREADDSLVGKNYWYWKDGLFHHSKANSMQSGLTAFAEGGACMVNRDIFMKLNGYDSLFAPFYWEDVDLCYRAYRLGYEVYFDSSILVSHAHESTIGKFFEKRTVSRIAFRNQLIFIWKNISDRHLRGSHRLYLLRYLLSNLIRGNVDPLRSYCAALVRIPRIYSRRRRLWKTGNVADTQILDRFRPS